MLRRAPRGREEQSRRLAPLILLELAVAECGALCADPPGGSSPYGSLLASLSRLLARRHGDIPVGQLIDRLAREEGGPIRQLRCGGVLAAVSPATHRGLEEDLEAGVLLRWMVDRRAGCGASRERGPTSDACARHLSVRACAAGDALVSREAVDAEFGHVLPFGDWEFQRTPFRGRARSARTRPTDGRRPAVLPFRKRVRLALRSAPRWSPPPRSRFTFA